MKKTDKVIPELASMNWVQAPSEPVKHIANPQEQPQKPKREKRQQPTNALTVRGLIPHISNLISLGGTLDPSSVEIVDQCGRVYLCRFVMVARPDPILPIVGLTWPREVWERKDSYVSSKRRVVKESYATLAHALASYGGSFGNSFKRNMSDGTNALLKVLTEGGDALCTDAEYAFVAKHLTQAMKNPQAYQ